MRRWSMFWQMFFAFAALIVVSLGALGGIIGAWVEKQSLAQVEGRLKAKALILQEVVRGRSVEEIRRSLGLLQEGVEARITLIAPNGKVMVETDRDPADLDDHSNRPEIEASRSAPFGAATRYSASIGKTMMYVAVFNPNNSDVAYVRVAMPVTEAHQQASQLRNFVWGTAAIAALLALLLAWLLTQRLVQPLRDLNAGAEKIAAGEYGRKVYIERKDEFGRLADTFNHMSTQLALQFAQLDEDRQQLRAVLGGMVEGVIAINSEQKVLFANERAGEMLGFSTQAAAGRKLWEVVRRHAIQDAVQQSLGTSAIQTKALEFTDPGGKTLMLHVARLPSMPTHGAVLVFHDTTDLRRLERMRQDFVANVSHELKTPLSVITACIETLLAGGVEDVENRGRFLERIHEQAQRLHLLILDLLSLARIESGEQLWTLQPLSVAEIAGACIERHQARADAKKQSLTLEPPPGEADIRVLADAEALAEILDNLVDNALKYTPDDGAIRLRWWSSDGHCQIEVEDTGIGIPETDLPRVFERFFRVDKARSRELGGTGLGLAIVKHLVQAMHGTATAMSQPGKGTTFSVRLPIAPREDAAQ